MKSAFQTEASLLADIAAARERGGSRIWWLGQSGFLLLAEGKTILFDPYLSDSLTKKYANTDKPHTRITERAVAPEWLAPIDFITSSHNHTDHLDAETLGPLLAANPHAKLLLPRANREFALQRLEQFLKGSREALRAIPPHPCPLPQGEGDVRRPVVEGVVYPTGISVNDRLVEIDAGETVTAAGVEFHGIPAAHPSVEQDEHGRCRFLGYIARIGSLAVYHSGDTVMHEGLADALRRCAPDVALVPINGNQPERGVAGNLNGVEAARLAKAIGARLAIPHHYDMFEFNSATPDEFEAECRRIGQPFRTLRHGEGLDLSCGLTPL